MEVSLIVAVSDNNVIGKDNKLIWHLPDDLKFFKETTEGHVVIMGRKNFESIPEKYRPLPNRTNIVITRQTDYVADGCVVVNSVENALAKSKEFEGKRLFIIGGGEIYNYCLKNNLVNSMYISRVHTTVEGDTHFPDIDDEKWRKIELRKVIKDAKNVFDFTIYQYIRN